MKLDKILKLEKRLQQQKQKLQQSEAFLREQKRKADIKRKITLGSLFYEVGLENIDSTLLLEELLMIKAKMQSSSSEKEDKMSVKTQEESLEKEQPYLPSFSPSDESKVLKD